MSTQADAGTERVQLQGTGFAVALTVKDLRVSRDWFRDVIGFTVEQEFEREGALRAVRVVAGSVKVLLNQDDGAKGWDRIKGQGFALSVSTDQSIDAIADSMKAAGATLLQEPIDAPWGVRMIRFVDPDGFIWSISAPLKS